MGNSKKIISVYIILLFVCLFICSNLKAQSTVLNEKFRPKLHFTPEKNWLNDPNGMFFYEGEYHLFYQYNPTGDKWGHIAWGHAVSTDLIKWQHLPIALEEEDQVMIFSGSAVVDSNNSSGFGLNNKPPIVAIYTSYDAKTGFQHQSIAYSNDKGRTFAKYAGNPVINLNSKDFRDPKVFWYEPEQKWIMTVSLSVEKKVQFYSSKNLIEWELMSQFGPIDGIDGIWECPDLFAMTHNGIKKWVLGVNLGSGSIAGGSGLMYFIGDFDGKKYTADQPVSNLNKDVKYIDYGKDFYAAVTWNGISNENTGKIWLGWMNNWQYSDQIPSYGWRGSMSLPRRLSLDKDAEEGYFIRQEPIETVQNYRVSEQKLNTKTIDKINQKLQDSDLNGLNFEIKYKFEPNKIDEFLDFEILNNSKSLLKLAFNKNLNEFTLTRIDKDIVKEEFQSVQKINIGTSKKVVDVRLFVDKYSVEVFVNGGRYVFTNLIFPEDFVNNTIQFNTKNNKEVKLNSMVVFKY